MHKIAKISIVAVVFILFGMANSCTKDSSVSNNTATSIHKFNIDDLVPNEVYPFVLPADMQPFQYAVYQGETDNLLAYIQSVFEKHQEGDEVGYFIISRNVDTTLINYGFITSTSIYYQPNNFVYPDNYVDPFVYPADDDDGGGHACYATLKTKNANRVARWIDRQLAMGRNITNLEYDPATGEWTVTSSENDNWKDPNQK